MTEITEHQITTPDRRTLMVREGGDPDGFPVFIHHGTPTAGLLFKDWAEDARGRGLRLLTHDRPGYGGSDRQPGRIVASVVADIRVMADELGLDRFATWGISGGGPHALACAAMLPDRVTAAASLASVAPVDAEGLDFMAGMGEDNVTEFSLALEDPDALRVLIEKWRIAMLEAEPEQVFESMKSLLSEVDQAVLTGEVAQFMHDSGQVGLADGVDGWFDDDLAFASGWGFDLDDIEVPLLLWQGRQDLFVPFAHGEWLAKHIPRVDARLLAEEGHVTLMVTRVADTHEWLKEKSGL
jgi:pimeloyl-ACP methyl ester carboxylesterase